jgi:hypothetical protein
MMLRESILFPIPSSFNESVEFNCRAHNTEIRDDRSESRVVQRLISAVCIMTIGESVYLVVVGLSTITVVFGQQLD